jgi:hypothetical protein
MNERTNERTNEQTYERTTERTKEGTNKRTYERAKKQPNVRTNQRMYTLRIACQIPSVSRCFLDVETLHSLLITSWSRDGFESVSIILQLPTQKCIN